MIPIGDFFGEPFLDRGFGFGDQGQAGIPDFLQVLGHHMGNGIALGLMFQFPADPVALRSGQDVCNGRLTFFQGPEVKIGGIMHVAAVAVGIQFHIQHLPGNDAAVAGPGNACVLEGMFKIKEHPGGQTAIGFIHQNRPPLEQIPVSLQGEINDGVQQGMARADKRGKGLALGMNQLFLKGDPLIPVQDRFPHAYEAVPVSDGGRHMGDFIAPGFPFPVGSAQFLKSFTEKGFNIMGLKTLGIGPLHVFPDSADFACIHGVMGQGPFFQQVLQLFPVQGMIQNRGQIGHDLGLFSIPDSLDEKIAQRFSLKLEFAQDIKDLAAEGLAGLFQFVQEFSIDIAFPGFFSHQIPQMADFGLTDTMNPSESLFNPVGVPGQVIIDHEMGALQINPFTGGIGGQEDLNLGIMAEGFLDFQAIFASNSPMNHDHGGFPSQKGGNPGFQIIEGVPVFGKNNQFLMDRGLVGRDGSGHIGFDFFIHGIVGERRGKDFI